MNDGWGIGGAAPSMLTRLSRTFFMAVHRHEQTEAVR